MATMDTGNGMTRVAVLIGGVLGGVSGGVAARAR